MTHVVGEPCINCKYTDCVAECPVDCFYEGVNMLVIHPDECIDCGDCVDACPTEVILKDVDLPAEWEAFIEINARAARSGWPNIRVKKENMGKPEDGNSLRELLDERPFGS